MNGDWEPTSYDHWVAIGMSLLIVLVVLGALWAGRLFGVW
jgi:hypothetical protein